MSGAYRFTPEHGRPVHYWAPDSVTAYRVARMRYGSEPGSLTAAGRPLTPADADGEQRDVYARIAHAAGASFAAVERACETARIVHGLSVQTYADGPSVAAALRALGVLA
ncbi:MAG TPA: hypothetical protein VMS45_02615 [Gemmatimonadaceae bacterium]|nr:hypothetical protein [Gemmatimonadaceae bacterium]